MAGFLQVVDCRLSIAWWARERREKLNAQET
jgi:hypothetical protein